MDESLKPAHEVFIERLEYFVQRGLDSLGQVHDYEMGECRALLDLMKEIKFTAAEMEFILAGLQRIAVVILKHEPEMDPQDFPRYLVQDLDESANMLRARLEQLDKEKKVMTEKLKPAHEILISEFEELVDGISVYVNAGLGPPGVAPDAVYLRECQLLCRVLGGMVIPEKHFPEVSKRIREAVQKLDQVHGMDNFQHYTAGLIQSLDLRSFAKPEDCSKQ